MMRSILAGTVAAAFTLAGLPAVAGASAEAAASAGAPGVPVSGFFFKKKKKKKKKKSSSKKKKSSSSASSSSSSSSTSAGPALTPDGAADKRQAIRDSVKADREAKKWDKVADGLEENAELLGDPITMMEAGEARLMYAKEKQDAEAAQASIVTTTKALDILHFYEAVAAGSAESDWLVIEPSSAKEMIPQAEQQIAAAESLIEELEEEEEDDGGKPVVAKKTADDKKKKKKKREKMKPGTGMIIGGSFALVAGVGGAGLGIAGIAISNKRQKQVEDLPGGEMDPMFKELDDQGKRANVLGYLGLGVAVVGIAVGIPLIAVGAKRRKQAGPGSQARVSVAPAMGGNSSGIVVSGRF